MISWGAFCTRCGASNNKTKPVATPMINEHIMYPEEGRKESGSRWKVSQIQICHMRNDSRESKR